jgi:hypothetical protein
MIIRREALSSALAAVTDDDTRYCLGSVQIRQNGDVAATDGHIALIVHDDRPMDTADFPIVPGADIHGELARDLSVPASTCKRLISSTQKGKRALPILTGVRVGRNGADGVSVLAATDLAVPAVVILQLDPHAQAFPDISRILPAADETRVRLSLSVEVLESLTKAAKAIGAGKRFQAITLQLPAPNEKTNAIDSAIRVEIKGADLSITGAAMPCRL